MNVLTVLGARPQFIKAAPVSHAIAASARLSERIVHTGQHYDVELSEVFFVDMGLPEPAHRLDVGSASHGAMTAAILARLEPILLDEKPHLVLVYGDTNSTLAGALAAVKLNIPVAHVEAGLRSFNRRMPEEINRVLTDHASTILFCPTQASVDNLAREGIHAAVHRVGDSMFDATLWAKTQSARRAFPELQALGLKRGEYSVATVHRAENTDDPTQLAAVFDYLRERARTRPMVLPLHPRSAKALAQAHIDCAPIRLCRPLGYLAMARLLADCAEVYTDSGGLQKEAYFHRKPCVTLRGETEWVETVTHGWNRLWSEPDYQVRRDIDEYGDGHSAARIVAILEAFDTRAA